jgi:hypothetical protein
MTKWLRVWILLCTWLVALGWILSLFGALIPITYEIALGLFAIGWFYKFREQTISSPKNRFIVRRLASRRLLLPYIFAITAALLLLKGIVTPPFHDDGLCYRIPRAMNWIMDHRWHWIGAEDARLDVLGTVSEWLSVPFLLIFHSDQLVFLPNWISYLFLPGLIFSVWRKLGVPPRIAWLSMWLLPTGFCFALQAVNTSNDSIGAFFVLAAIFFALKGCDSSAWGDLALSILCMALATGVKLNLLALGLAWIVAIVPGWKTLLSRPVSTLGTLFVAILVSFAPTAYFNSSHGRGWTGLEYVQPTPPLVNYVCTSFHLIVQNLTPPLLVGPHPAPYVIPGIQDTLLGQLMDKYFLPPVVYAQVAIEQAGLGFVVCIAFVLIFLTSQAPVRPKSAVLFSMPSRRFLIFGSLTLAFFHYMFFVNSDQPARLICVYYLLLLPAFFVGRSPREAIPWFLYKIGVAIAMMAGLYLALFLTENPLCNYILRFDERLYWDWRDIETTRAVIPEQEKAVGIIRFYNQRQTWLWKPYGTRRVIELPLKPDANRVRELGINYLVISNEMLVINNLTIDSWLADQPWTLVGSVIAGRDNTWYFLKLKK